MAVHGWLLRAWRAICVHTSENESAGESLLHCFSLPLSCDARRTTRLWVTATRAPTPAAWAATALPQCSRPPLSSRWVAGASKHRGCCCCRMLKQHVVAIASAIAAPACLAALLFVLLLIEPLI